MDLDGLADVVELLIDQVLLPVKQCASCNLGCLAAFGNSRLFSTPSSGRDVKNHLATLEASFSFSTMGWSSASLLPMVLASIARSIEKPRPSPFHNQVGDI